MELIIIIIEIYCIAIYIFIIIYFNKISKMNKELIKDVIVKILKTITDSCQNGLSNTEQFFKEDIIENYVKK